MSIRAVTVDPNATAHLAIATVDDPKPLPNEALIRVHALSLNRGEVRGAQAAAAGARPGWDIAGVIEQAAVDGSGPKVGERVVGMLRTGAWAELATAPTTNIAVLPDNVSFQQASTLPVAGLTALYALDRGDGLLERNVLITGASGGVGHIGVQLAVQGGARVTGLVRQEKHSVSVKDAGAHNVVADETGMAAQPFGPYNLILESVGGQVLANVMGMCAPMAHVVCYGISGGGPATFDSSVMLRSRLNVSGLAVFTEIGRETASVGLGRLVRMVSAGTLKPLVAVEAPWTEIGAIAQGLLDRAYPGKAVLLVS
jgi:NADPH:quinone reductase-like Zn-dependent oxidoreductase